MKKKKKWWIGALIVVAVICIAAVAAGGDDTITSTATEPTNQVQTEDTSTDDTSDTEAMEYTTEPEEPEMTTAQENAYASAQSYIEYQAFSKAGLIDQLSSDAGEGYKLADAKFAVKMLEKNDEVNWKEQAYKSAKNYLSFQNFSKSGLIDQLESEAGEQFTHAQAVYGANKAYK